MIASLVFNLFLFIATTVAKLLIDKYTPANSEQSTPTHWLSATAFEQLTSGSQ
jgi:hypothetical protein